MWVVCKFVFAICSHVCVCSLSWCVCVVCGFVFRLRSRVCSLGKCVWVVCFLASLRSKTSEHDDTRKLASDLLNIQTLVNSHQQLRQQTTELEITVCVAFLHHWLA